MSTLARRRHIPPPATTMAELEVDLSRLRRIYEQIRAVPELHAEGEALIRAARAAGISVKEIARITERTPQLIYQVLQKDRNDRGGRTNGNGSNGDASD